MEGEMVKMNNMKKLVLYLLLFITLLLQQSCQEKFTPELSTAEPLLVVEGHIELSEDFALPPYVILTRSIPFYSEISLEDIENLFVHDALVEVSDGSQSVLLEEYCWENIPEDFQDMIIETVAELEGNTYNFCIYTDLSFSLSVKEGVTYSLHIETDKEVATAHTTIPSFVPLDSVYFAPAPGGHGDSLMELQIV
ncbi:MAG TPA: DUF4249 family protein, partial [Phaeodactylibacter sp.]|nr:DUF4249 family protein [Phaeodactylibacter sp.]